MADRSRRARPSGWLAASGVVGLAAVVAVLLAPGLLGSPTPDEALPAPRLIDESATAGIDHTYDGEFTFFVGGGVAVFDCDDDALPDVYLAGGVNPAGLYRNRSEPAGRLSFAAIPSAVTDLVNVTGAYPIDIDSDDHIDLAVLRLGENVLLRGLGDCRFERANELWGVDGGDAWTAAFSATWEGAAELPTLAFGNYVSLDEEGRQFGGCSDNVLWRPQASGTYAPTTLSPGWCTLSILFSDWSRSGQADLRMTNDRHYYRDGEEQLWKIVQARPPELYSRADGWNKMQIWGMGIASQDVTGDGLPEVLLTSQGDNKLQALDGSGTEPDFSDIAIRRGTTAHRPYVGDTVLPSTAWHAEFQDANNDGFMDLYIAKGNVEAMPEFAAQDPNNLLLGQPDGTFVEAGEEAGIATFTRTRGAALADFNLDGLLDLVEVNRREPARIWRNVGSGTPESPIPMGNWIALRLRQDGPNGHGVGAWIEVKIGESVVTREVTIGGGHAGGQLGWIHFGLGDARRAELRVVWPDGDPGPWLTVAANQLLIVDEGAAEAEVWPAPNG